MLLIDVCLRQARSETKTFQNETKNVSSLMGLILKNQYYSLLPSPIVYSFLACLWQAGGMAFKSQANSESVQL